MKKMLVVYYSVSNGNTKTIAEALQKNTGADIQRIETIIPYTGSYEEIVNQGNEEVQNGYMPEIKKLDVDIKDYDVIAIGTPTWWYTVAPAVDTFLYQNNFKGKTVIPFMTNGGWPGHVIKDIKEGCKGAIFSHEMEIQFDSTGESKLETNQKDIEQWINDIKEMIQ